MKSVVLPDVADVVGATDLDRRWLNDAVLRERAGSALQTGLTRELWKYTPIRGFLDGLAASTHAAEPLPLLENGNQPGLTITALHDLQATGQAWLQQVIEESLDADRHPLADLSLLRAPGGWLVEVDAEVAQYGSLFRSQSSSGQRW